MKVEDAIGKLHGNILYAERDMYNSEIYSSSETAKKEIDALELAISALEKIQHGELVEVVRCKDCEYWSGQSAEECYGNHVKNDGYSWVQAYEDGYCSNGKRGAK